MPQTSLAAIVTPNGQLTYGVRPGAPTVEKPSKTHENNSEQRVNRNVKLHRKILGYGGVIGYLKSQLTQSKIIYEMQRKDCRHPFYLRIPSSDVPTYKQVFIDLEYDFSAASPPDVIVDAGANIGLASIYLANKYPSAKIIAIEPEQSNFTLLKKNVEAYPNIQPVQAALWHKNEEINLVDPGLGNWGFMTAEKGGSDTSVAPARHTVRAMTVDKVMEAFDLKTINILKIDIEGAEKEVFSDTTAWINRVDSMIVELHERMKSGCNRSFYLGSVGFEQEWMQGENVYLSRSGYLTRA